MDLTYDEYINYINDLFLQEMLDESYHYGKSDSTDNALTLA